MIEQWIFSITCPNSRRSKSNLKDQTKSAAFSLYSRYWLSVIKLCLAWDHFSPVVSMHPILSDRRCILHVLSIKVCHFMEPWKCIFSDICLFSRTPYSAIPFPRYKLNDCLQVTQSSFHPPYSHSGRYYWLQENNVLK